MGFRDEFRGTGRTYAQWTLEDTTETGLRANSEQLQNLKLAVKSTFDQGITRIVESQEAIADSLRDELAYQSDQICQEVQRSSEEVVGAIQQMADYLGAGLSEVRWAVERHTKVSEETLRVLLSSLNNKSRQYWEQGVACYEGKEFGFAKERFEKALEANRTNCFAYEYLGFVAVDEDNADAAIRNFDLARKFSKTNHHRAIALSHLARSSHATGDIANAVAFSKAAVDTDPQVAGFSYQHAAYSAESGDAGAAIASLSEAIQADWNYWGVAAIDPSLDCIREKVDRFFEELRSRERNRAAEGLERLRSAIEKSKQLSGDPVSAPCVERLSVLQGKFSKDNVHQYREIQRESLQATKHVYQFASDALARKNSDLASSVALLQEKMRTVNEKSFAGFGFICAVGSACLAYFLIALMFSSKPEVKGPFRVFNPTQNVPVNRAFDTLSVGSARQVVNESETEVTLRFNDGNLTFPKADLLKFGRLETGYVQDGTRTLGRFPWFFWQICVPIIVWAGTSKLRKKAATSQLLGSVTQIENMLTSIRVLQQEAQDAIRAISLSAAE